MPAGRLQWDGKNEKDVIAKLQEIWALGGTNAEGSYYADVSESSITRYLQNDLIDASFRRILVRLRLLFESAYR